MSHKDKLCVPVKCHVSPVCHKLGSHLIPATLTCPVVVLSCFACSEQFQGHLKKLRQAVV